ncbi:MAG: hypothetical protein EpisKO_41750 [Epibacterium sp.]
MAVQDLSSLRTRLAKNNNTRARTMAGGFAANMGEQQTTHVSDIAGEMMSKDNPLMARARTQGAQVANRRGMLNSSAAAGEAANAVLDRVVPMASQEAQQRHTTQLSDRQHQQRLGENEQQYGFAAALSQQDFEQSAQLSEQQFEQASQLSDQEFEQQFNMSREQYRQQLEIQNRDQAFQVELSEQQFEQASQLSEQEFRQQMGMSREEYRQNLQLQEREQNFQSRENNRDRRTTLQTTRMQLANDRQLARMDSQTRRQLMRMESDMRERIAQLDVDSQTQAQAADMVTAVNNQYQTALNTILANPDLDAEERNSMLAASGELLNHQVTMIEGLFGIDFDWMDSAFDISESRSSSDDEVESSGGRGSSGSGGNSSDGGGNSGNGGAGGYGY